MHPIAVALMLRGCRLIRRPPHNIGFQLIVQYNDRFYGRAAGDGGFWMMVPVSAQELPSYQEVAWSEIPDSLWATCDLEEAVRVLES